MPSYLLIPLAIIAVLLFSYMVLHPDPEHYSAQADLNEKDSKRDS